VPTKVTTENGLIDPGDLLLSSPNPGYAMKGTDRDRLAGTVIGKALAPCASETSYSPTHRPDRPTRPWCRCCRWRSGSISSSTPGAGHKERRRNICGPGLSADLSGLANSGYLNLLSGGYTSALIEPESTTREGKFSSYRGVIPFLMIKFP